MRTRDGPKQDSFPLGTAVLESFVAGNAERRLEIQIPPTEFCILNMREADC